MAGRFQSYPSYKDSGVEWLGRIPANWQVKRLKFLASQPLAYGANESAELNDPSQPRFIRITDINNDGSLHDDTFRSLPEEVARPFLLKQGDLLLARSGATVGKTFMYRESWGRACHAGYLIRCRLNRAIAHPEFVSYFATSSTYWGWLSSVFIQATIQNVSAEKYGNLFVPLPQLEEQRAIAGFLDQETGKIDALVKKKERLIELLQEKRTALISHAVTQGLNPNAPKKDSGIPWLGHIPKHWQLKKLGHVANIVRGGSPRPAGDPRFFDGDACPWITVAEVTKDNGKFLNETETCLTDEGRRHSRFLHAGTLVMTNSGATLGVPKILNISGCINDGSVAFLDLKPSVVRNYLYFYLASLTENLRDRIKQGSGQPNLNTSIFRSIWFPVGDVDEQEQIADYLDRETAKLDALIAKVRTAIERLQKYRTALISAAVTGQIDVRQISSRPGTAIADTSPP